MAEPPNRIAPRSGAVGERSEAEDGVLAHFEFRFEQRYLRAARPFGITPGSAYVEVSEHWLRAGFGRWLVQTPLTNITGVSLTGPYRFLKTAGPARLGITDRGLTFATNGQSGVCMRFERPVWGIDRHGLIRHPNLTVTVDNPERLAQLLATRADFASSLRSLIG